MIYAYHYIQFDMIITLKLIRENACSRMVPSYRLSLPNLLANNIIHSLDLHHDHIIIVTVVVLHICCCVSHQDHRRHACANLAK